MNNEENNINTNESIKEQNKRKVYKAPKLTLYGEISTLVQANAGVGPDGGADALSTFSM